MTDRVIPADTGDAMLLDALGAVVVQLKPSDDIGILLDLEGKLNKLDIRDVHRYILSAAMAAELIAELVVAAQGANSHDGKGDDFANQVQEAIAAEQRRRGLI